MLKGLVTRVQHALLRMSFGPGARARLYRMLHARTRDGHSVYSTLLHVQEMSNKFGIFPASVIGNLVRNLRGGGNGEIGLGKALEPWCEPLEAMIIATSGRAGRVSIGLREAANVMEMRSRISGLIRSKLLRPVIYLAGLVVVLAVNSAVLVPVMEGASPRTAWPMYSQALGWMADHVVGLTAGTLGSIAAWLGAFVLTVNRWVGPTRALFDRFVMPWSIHREVQGAAILNVIAMLARAKVGINQAVVQIRSVSPAWLAWHMEAVTMRQRRGATPLAALAGVGDARRSLFRPIVGAEISFYDNSSDPENALSQIAGELNIGVEARLAQQLGFVQSALLLAVVTVLGIALVSTMGVLLNISNRY